MKADTFGQGWEFTPDERALVTTVVDGVADAERIIAHAEAMKAHFLATAELVAEQVIARSDAPSAYRLPERAIAEDIAAAVRVPGTTIRARMSDAATLTTSFPATFAALAEGRISARHATVIAQEGGRLSTDLRTRYEAAVLPAAAPTTAARLRPVASSVAEQLDPTTIGERHEAVRAERRTWVDDLGDGMSEFHAVVESPLAHGMQDRLTQMAATIRAAARHQVPSAFGSLLDELGPVDPDPVDERTLAQIRADVFADLMLTGAPTARLADGDDGSALGAIRARLQVTIPVGALTGLGDDAAFLAGHGPMSPTTARALAGRAARWARLFVDPATGVLRSVDSYAPTAEQRRFLTARDEHCRFPGCRQPVHRCDLDHAVAHSAGGQTAVGNLAALCRAHHVLKHNGRWTVEHGPGGLLTWTSPTGRRIDDRPAPAVRFVTAAIDPDPPPDDPPF